MITNKFSVCIDFSFNEHNNGLHELNWNSRNAGSELIAGADRQSSNNLEKDWKYIIDSSEKYKT